MRDYVRLCKALRHCATHFSCSGCGGDCKTGSNEPRTKAVLNETADAIEELLAAVPHWISVEDELPENHKNVLCCGAKGGMFVGWVSGIATVSNGKTIAFAHGGEGRCITHWMPLPESPKEVRDA